MLAPRYTYALTLRQETHTCAHSPCQEALIPTHPETTEGPLHSTQYKDLIQTCAHIHTPQGATSQTSLP